VCVSRRERENVRENERDVRYVWSNLVLENAPRERSH